MAKVGRNDPCPCGSGKKYKKCCWSKHHGKRKLQAKVIQGATKGMAGALLQKEEKPEEEALPPEVEEKVKCMHCGFGNSVGVETCESCGKSLVKEEKYICPKCGYELESPSQDCPRCSREFEEVMGEEVKEKKEEEQFVFHSVKPFSFIMFLGIVGFFIGVILGAFTGASEYFSDVVSRMQDFFRNSKVSFLEGLYLLLSAA